VETKERVRKKSERPTICTVRAPPDLSDWKGVGMQCSAYHPGL
jgi:hypothetical protein